MNHLRLKFAIVMALLCSGAVEAKVLGQAVRANAHFISGQTLVPLDAGGTTTLSVVNNKARAVNAVLTYSAVCSVMGGGTSGYIDIDVVVNDQAVAPTDTTTDMLCTSSGTPALTSWHRTSITLVVRLQPGTNTVQIVGRLNLGATTGALADSALVITD